MTAPEVARTSPDGEAQPALVTVLILACRTASSHRGCRPIDSFRTEIEQLPDNLVTEAARAASPEFVCREKYSKYRFDQS